MKNEPVVTYNHMQEDSSSVSNSYESSNPSSNHPISLYMIFAVDLILIFGIGVLVFQLIF